MERITINKLRLYNLCIKAAILDRLREMGIETYASELWDKLDQNKLKGRAYKMIEEEEAEWIRLLKSKRKNPDAPFSYVYYDEFTEVNEKSAEVLEHIGKHYNSEKCKLFYGVWGM